MGAQQQLRHAGADVAREEKALPLAAPDRGQVSELLPVFQTLGDDRRAEPVGHAQHGGDDRAAARVAAARVAADRRTTAARIAHGADSTSARNGPSAAGVGVRSSSDRTSTRPSA